MKLNAKFRLSIMYNGQMEIETDERRACNFDLEFIVRSR